MIETHFPLAGRIIGFLKVTLLCSPADTFMSEGLLILDKPSDKSLRLNIKVEQRPIFAQEKFNR